MAHKPVDKTIEKLIEDRQKLDERLALAREKKRRQDRAHRQRLERQIGRMAMAYDLHLLVPDELKAVFQQVQRDHPHLHSGEGVLEES